MSAGYLVVISSAAGSLSKCSCDLSVCCNAVRRTKVLHGLISSGVASSLQVFSFDTEPQRGL